MSATRDDSAPPKQDGAETRAALISTAEQLFADRGVEAVTLNQIRLVAGVRNRSAVQYHFGDRNGLIAAIIGKHAPRFEQRRLARLAALDAGSQPAGQRMAVALRADIEATMEFLDDPDGGRNYLLILTELTSVPRLAEIVARCVPEHSAPFQSRELDDGSAADVATLLVSSAMVLHSIVGYVRFREAGRAQSIEPSHIVDALMRMMSPSLAGPDRGDDTSAPG